MRLQEQDLMHLQFCWEIENSEYILQKLLLMFLHLLFWLNSYHVTARNTATNPLPATPVCKIALACTDLMSSVKHSITQNST